MSLVTTEAPIACSSSHQPVATPPEHNSLNADSPDSVPPTIVVIDNISSANPQSLNPPATKRVSLLHSLSFQTQSTQGRSSSIQMEPNNRDEHPDDNSDGPGVPPVVPAAAPAVVPAVVPAAAPAAAPAVVPADPVVSGADEVVPYDVTTDDDVPLLPRFAGPLQVEGDASPDPKARPDGWSRFRDRHRGSTTAGQSSGTASRQPSVTVIGNHQPITKRDSRGAADSLGAFFQALVATSSQANRKTLAEEVREERLEELREASALRSLSMTNVCGLHHPGMNAAVRNSFTQRNLFSSSVASHKSNATATGSLTQLQGSYNKPGVGTTASSDEPQRPHISLVDTSKPHENSLEIGDSHFPELDMARSESDDSSVDSGDDPLTPNRRQSGLVLTDDIKLHSDGRPGTRGKTSTSGRGANPLAAPRDSRGIDDHVQRNSADRGRFVSMDLFPTFTSLDCVYLMFTGIPAALRQAPELEPWLLPSTIVSNFTLCVVLVACASFCLESLPENYYADPAPVYLQAIAYFCMSWLTIEWFVRLVSCRSAKDFLLMPLSWIDIASNIPYYIQLLSGGQRTARILILLRILRLVRILRVFDLSKHNIGMQAVFGAIRKSVSALTLFLLMLTFILFVGSSLVFMAEMTGESFDNVNNILTYTSSGDLSPYGSIWHSIWFVITTVTTVGYGEMVVQTPLGRAISAILMLIGPFVVAFPTVILSANLQDTHRELLESAADRGGSDEGREMSAEESKIRNETRSAEYNVVMKDFVPQHVRAEIDRRNEIIKHGADMQHNITYSLSYGAPSRNIRIVKDMALYDPLLLLQCAHPEGEPEYGYQSRTGVWITVRDNFPAGAIVRFKVLLHTIYSQEAATLAVHQYMKLNPEKCQVTTVAPRAIRVLRVSVRSKNALLSHLHVVCNKYLNPFGTIPVEVVVPKSEVLPVLLRYASSCTFHFTCEFHDSYESTDVVASMGSLLGRANVEYDGRSCELRELLERTVPASTMCERPNE